MRVCQQLRGHLWELGILKRLTVSPAVYPRFLEIAELARFLCHSWATCLLMNQTRWSDVTKWSPSARRHVVGQVMFGVWSGIDVPSRSKSRRSNRLPLVDSEHRSQALQQSLRTMLMLFLDSFTYSLLRTAKHSYNDGAQNWDVHTWRRSRFFDDFCRFLYNSLFNVANYT